MFGIWILFIIWWTPWFWQAVRITLLLLLGLLSSSLDTLGIEQACLSVYLLLIPCRVLVDGITSANRIIKESKLEIKFLRMHEFHVSNGTKSIAELPEAEVTSNWHIRDACRIQRIDLMLMTTGMESFKGTKTLYMSIELSMCLIIINSLFIGKW